MIRRVAIGIPARDEEERIAACLRSVVSACEEAHLPSTIVVVSDSSTDETAEISRRVLRQAGDFRWSVLERSFGKVGPTRDLACRQALALHDDTSPSQVWLATTDADSEVPRDWLTAHLRHHRDGWDGVAGLVTLDASDTTDVLRDRFQRAIADRGVGHGHPHVHGANLGIVASAFVASDGFGDVSVGEDQQLWERAKAAGFRVTGTSDGVVVTSARRHGRAVGGLATFLSELCQ